MNNPTRTTMNCDLHHYGRVRTDNANRYQSERTFNDNVNICPSVKLNDLMGRGAIVNTLYTKAPGCNTALDRQCVENKLRSDLFSSVQLSAVGVETGGNTATVDAIQSLVAMEHMSAPQMNIPDRMAVYNQTLRNVQWDRLANKVQYYKAFSGMWQDR